MHVTASKSGSKVVQCSVYSAQEEIEIRDRWLITTLIMDKELTSAANRGRPDCRGICYALLCWVNIIVFSLPSDTIYLARTLTIFNNGSICPRKEFTLLSATTIFPPTDECFYFFLIFISFSAAFSIMPLSLQFGFIFVHFTVLLCFCVCLWLCVLISLYQGLPCWSLQKLTLEICINLLHQFIAPCNFAYMEMIQCSAILGWNFNVL